MGAMIESIKKRLLLMQTIHIARSISKIDFELLVLHDIIMQNIAVFTSLMHYDIIQNLLYIYI